MIAVLIFLMDFPHLLVVSSIYNDTPAIAKEVGQSEYADTQQP